jgi:hypothetical protein
MSNLNRRAALLGAGIAALLSQAAQAANTTFELALFKTTSGSSARDEADRWNDVLNVKDFGATGNGVTDDTTACQAALNALTTQVGQNNAFGAVYFPRGTYLISSALTFQNQSGGKGIKIFGDGRGSLIKGNINAYLLDNSLNLQASGPCTIEQLEIANANTTVGSGGIRFLSSVGGAIRDCKVTGCTAINVWDTNFVGVGGASIQIQDCVLICASPYTTGTIGILLGNGHQAIGCDITNFDNGIRASNVGNVIIGGRFEVNITAINLGMSSQGATDQSVGFIISGCSMEANEVGILFTAGTNGIISGVSISGTVGAHDGNSHTGIDLTGASSTVVAGVNCGGTFSTASFVIPNNKSDLTFISCLPNNSHSSPTIWSGGNGSTYIGCNQPASVTTVAFASLPTSPYIGQEMIINNCNSTTVGAVAAGGGANTVPVKWWGTNWRIVASGV